LSPAGAERRALEPLWMLVTGVAAGAVATAAVPIAVDPRLSWAVVALGVAMASLACLGRRGGMVWLAAGLALGSGRGAQASIHDLELIGLLDGDDPAAIRVEARLLTGWEPTRWGYRASVRLRSASRGERRIDLAPGWRMEVRGVDSPGVLPPVGSAFGCLASVRGDAAHPFLAVASPAMLEVVSSTAGVAGIRDRLARGLVSAAGTDHRRIRTAELAAALALGRRDLLTAQRREGWRRSGMAHLLAVSGLHVGTVAASLWLVLAAANLHPRKLRWVMLAALPAYAVVAGASPSAVRAAMMASVYLAGRQLGRAVIPMASVLLVTAVLLVAGPRLVAEAGFQLTVLVTAALVRWVPPLSERLPGPRWLSGIVAVPVVAQLAAAPIIAHHFRSAVPGAVAANLLVPPLLAPLLTAALAATAVAPLWPAGARTLLDGMAAVEAVLWACGRPGRAVELVPPTMPAVVTSVLEVAGWMALRPGPVGRRGIALWLSTFTAAVLWCTLRPHPAGPRVELLPVGDGLAATVWSGRAGVLVDAGRWRREAAELLADGGVRRLAAVAVSHPDEDHFGGTETVLRTLPVGELLIPSWMLGDPVAVPLLRTARRRGVAVTALSRGRVIALDGMNLEVLWPPLADLPADDNERSLAIRFRTPGGAAMVTSDIGRSTELKLLRSGSLRCDVLVVPHHGSRHSACAALLERCRPDVALIPAGPLNRYHHPHAEVLERLGSRAIGFRYPKRDGRCGARVIDDRWVLYP
jgi:competence protein ComEC